MKYKIRRVPGGYSASLLVPLGDGRHAVFTGIAREREIRKRIEDSAQVEGFFGSIGRAVTSLTKSKALRKAVGTATGVLSNPAVTAALTAVNPVLGIGLKTSIDGLSAAEKLMRNAKSGKPGSAKRVAARATLKAARLVAQREDREQRKDKLLRLPMVNQALLSAGPGRMSKPQAKVALNYLVQLLGL